MQNNYYLKHAKQQEGVDKEEKTMKHHYWKSQRGLQRAFFLKKKSNKNHNLKQRKELFKEKAPPRIATPQQISGWQPGRSSATDG